MHDYYLDELVNQLELIGENRREIRWIMKDGIWQPDGFERKKLCDLICVYKDRVVPIELKGSRKKRKKAREQIQSGMDFAKYELGMDAPYGKFVVYGKGRYRSELV